MSTMSYLSAIGHYHEYRGPLQELLGSIVTGIEDIRLLDDTPLQRQAMDTLLEHYPFFDLLYALDERGMQLSENICACSHCKDGGIGTDRSRRPYFLAAQQTEGVSVTEPYFSNVTGELCLTVIIKVKEGDQLKGYLALDIDLVRAIEFLMGDSVRRKFQPAFRAMYSCIVLGLFGVVMSLFYLASSEMFHMIWGAATTHEMIFKPFTTIIYLTLALAIFDLGKTILEEEVLMHKDIFRHSSTRRTITRFIAAILIAVSIEALLLMFKSALGEGQYMVEAVWMMMAAVGLLIGLGLYVYLGAKAENILLKNRGHG